MKFTCTQTALSKAINTVSKAVSVRTTIPILKGILFTVEEGRLKLSASDLDMSIETCIDVQGAENGSCVVSAKLLGEIVRKLPNSLIVADTDKEYGKLSLSCLGSSFSLISLPAEEFPVIGSLNSEEVIDINKKDLEDLIKKVVFSASIDEKKGLLTGVLLNIKENVIEAVALDGFRMAIASKKCNISNPHTIIIPANILTEVSKILTEDDGSEEITLVFEEKKVEFRTEDTYVVARLLEGEFIKYRDILPQTFNTRVTVNRDDLFSSIERASLFAKEGKNNLIKLNINENGININSKSEEGTVNENIDAFVEGESLVIGFNSKYILDVLKTVNDEEVVFEMGTSVSSCIIKPTDGDDYTYLVLPVRITV